MAEKKYYILCFEDNKLVEIDDFNDVKDVEAFKEKIKQKKLEEEEANAKFFYEMYTIEQEGLEKRIKLYIECLEKYIEESFGFKYLIKIIFITLLGIFLFFLAGNKIYNLNKYGLNSKKINFIEKNLSEEEKLKYEYYINNLSTLEEKEKFSTYMYLKLKEKEDRKIENMVNTF